MSSSTKIDFESYFALLATSLERFSLPGLGTFVWHIERCEVDPKAAQIKPPRPNLKYEAGQRYFSDTAAFIMDHYALSREEAEAFLKELGNLLVGYLKVSPELDVWKLGKLRRTGVTYRLELAEEAPLSFREDLLPVSLRVAEGAVAPLGAAAPVPAASTTSKKSTQSEKKTSDMSRAKAVEVPPQPRSARSRSGRGLLLIGVILLVLIAVGLAAYFILSKRQKAAPVEITLNSKGSTNNQLSKTSPAPSAPEKSDPASPPEPPKKPAPPKESTPPQETRQSSQPAPKPQPVSPPSAVATPQKGRYYIIVGSYPSLDEAKAKAQGLAGSPEYLPGKEPGWVRLSLYSSTDKTAVQTRLKELKAQIPDAWVYTP
jgi:cell division septation protein DedD